jgi:hypothetical protein
MVTVPKAISASSNARVIASRSSTSAEIATARPPACSMREVHRRELLLAAGDQRDRRAFARQHLGEAHAKPRSTRR